MLIIFIFIRVDVGGGLLLFFFGGGGHRALFHHAPADALGGRHVRLCIYCPGQKGIGLGGVVW